MTWHVADHCQGLEHVFKDQQGDNSILVCFEGLFFSEKRSHFKTISGENASSVRKDP